MTEVPIAGNRRQNMNNPAVAISNSGVQENNPWFEENSSAPNHGDPHCHCVMGMYPVWKNPPYTAYRVRNVGSSKANATTQNKMYERNSELIRSAFVSGRLNASRYCVNASGISTIKTI